MKKVAISKDTIVVEEEKKKLFGGVKLLREEFRIEDIISVGKIQENGNFFAITIILEGNREINLSNDEVDIVAVIKDLENVSNGWEKFKLDIIEI